MQWYREADPKSRAMARRYVKPRLFERFSAACVRVVYASPANLAIIPMQDILGLGANARMNVPSTVGGNGECSRAGSPRPAQKSSAALRTPILDKLLPSVQNRGVIAEEKCR